MEKVFETLFLFSTLKPNLISYSISECRSDLTKCVNDNIISCNDTNCDCKPGYFGDTCADG